MGEFWTFFIHFHTNGPLYTGKWGMGDLEFSEVIFSIQNDLYNWGARDYFLLNLSKYVVNYTILFEQSKGESGW